MKKSQVAALALAYVAGGVVAPLSSIYAESVTEGCTPSVTDETLSVISGDEIDAIVAGIKKIDKYGLYESAQTTKAKYDAIVEYNGAEMTLAQSIDQAYADAQSAVSNAETSVTDANTAIGSASTLTNLATMVKDLMNEGKTPEPYPTPSDFAALVDDAETKVPFYNEYRTLIKAVVAGDVEATQAAARALNVAQTQAGKDPEFAKTDAVLKNGATISDIRTSLGNATLHPVYIKHKRIFDLTYLQADKLETLRTAKADLAESQSTLTQAEDAYEKALGEVNEVFANFKKAGVAVKNFKPRTSVAELNSLITGAYRGNKNNIIIAGYDEWSDFVTYINGVEADADGNSDLYAEIKTELQKVISDEAVINDILNPTESHKVCDINNIVAVRGNLPLYHLAVKVAKADDIADFQFKGNTQVVYDITIEHKGAAYTGLVGNYDVVVKLPVNIDVETVRVMYVNGNQYESMEVSERDAENGTVTFKTNHFSHYAIIADKAPADPDYGGNDSENDGYQIDDDFGGFGGDEGYDNPELPDESFGGYDDDSQFNVEPGVVIVPGETTTEKPSVVPTPNTGIVASAKNTATNAKPNQTIAIIASLIAVAGAAIAMIARRFHREA